MGRQHSISLTQLGDLLLGYLTTKKLLPVAETAAALGRDYQRGGREDLPLFLRPHLPAVLPSRRERSRAAAMPKRQERHLAVQP